MGGMRRKVRFDPPSRDCSHNESQFTSTPAVILEDRVATELDVPDELHRMYIKKEADPRWFELIETNIANIDVTSKWLQKICAAIVKEYRYHWVEESKEKMLTVLYMFK